MHQNVLRLSISAARPGALVLSFLLVLLGAAPVIRAQGPSASTEETPWWDSAWAHRVPIVAETGGDSLAQVQVRIDLSAERLPSLEWGGDAGALRFVACDESSGEQRVLPHWLTTDRITHGAWFACCSFSAYQQYHTPAATYFTFNRPIAERRVGLHDRTYFAYGDFGRDPCIRYFDHDTATLSPAVIPDRTQIPGDAHGNPTLLIDPAGHLYLFYGSHGNSIQVLRSAEPEAIERWEARATISCLGSYPQPYMLDDETILVSFREGRSGTTRPQSYVTSTNQGASWSARRDVIIAPGTAVYGMVELGNETPLRSYHLAFTPFEYASTLYPNVYYVCSDDGLQTFRTRGGQDLGPGPLGLDEVELVYDSGGRTSHIYDLVLDETNTPYILFNVGPWDQSGAPGPGEWRCARYDDDTTEPGRWVSSPIAPCDHLFDRGCLLADGDGQLRAYLPIAEDQHDGGEVTEFISPDGGRRWFCGRAVTANSEYSHNHIKRVRHAHPDLEILWSYGDSEPTGTPESDQASELMLYGADGILGSLAPRRARAYVRAPALADGTVLYAYYGNPAVASASTFSKTMATSFARLPTGEPDSDLEIEWLMEEAGGSEVHDTSGNGHHGQVVAGGDPWRSGGSTFGRRYDVGYEGTVLELVHLDYAVVPELTGPAGLEQLTVEIWFRPDDWSGSLYPRGPLVGLGASAEHLLVRVYNNDRIEFYTRSTVSTLHGGYFAVPHLGLRKWHQLVALYDGAEMRLYLDGIESKTRYEQSGPIAFAGEPLAVGKAGGDTFSGQIDEFRLYARVLSAEEILAHYHKTMPAEIGVRFGPEESRGQGVRDVAGAIRLINPNPFRGTTEIRLALADRAAVSFGIYDVAGRCVRRLLERGILDAGEYGLAWDGSNDRGDPLPSGIYFGRLQTGQRLDQRRLVLVR